MLYLIIGLDFDTLLYCFLLCLGNEFDSIIAEHAFWFGSKIDSIACEKLNCLILQGFA